MFATGVTMGLAEWIDDDTCLVIYLLFVYLLDNFNLASLPRNILLAAFFIKIHDMNYTYNINSQFYVTYVWKSKLWAIFWSISQVKSL